MVKPTDSTTENTEDHGKRLTRPCFSCFPWLTLFFAASPVAPTLTELNAL